MATRLGLYNDALITFLGERKLSSLSENREPRRVLDDIWNNELVDNVLSMGYWNFALRSVRLDYDSDVSPEFGYTRAFAKPTDWIKTANISLSDRFDNPLLDYSDEGDYIYCDSDVIYLQFVSNDVDFGGDLSKWTAAFSEYVSCYLASKSVKRLTQGKADEDSIKRDLKKLLVTARSIDAMNEPTKFLPQGGWTRSRSGGRGTSRFNTNGTLTIT